MKLNLLPVPLLLIALLAIPLALGWVPPNWVYGFRTLQSVKSPDVWYAANHRAGFIGLLFGLIGAILVAAVVRIPSISDAAKISIAAVLTAFVAIAMTFAGLVTS